MFMLQLVSAVRSILASRGLRWAPVLMAVGVIPAGAAYLVPGLLLAIGVLVATRPAKWLALDR